MKDSVKVILFTFFAFCSWPQKSICAEKSFSELTNCRKKFVFSLAAQIKWARAGSDLAKRAALAQAAGDHLLASGAIIDKSCFNGPRKKHKQAIIKYIEESLLFAHKRMQDCSSEFGLKEHQLLPSILSNLVIMCGEVEASALAMSQMAVNLKDQISLENFPFSYKKKVLFCARSKECEKLGPLIFINHKYIDALNSKTDVSALGIHDFADTLIHESMHFLAANNRDEHGKGTKKNCKQSKFNDYIYFSSALCFPDAPYNKNFIKSDRTGLVHCQGLCEKAIGVTESNTIKFNGKLIGPSLELDPYQKDMAKKKCNEIRQKAIAWYEKVKQKKKIRQKHAP